MTTRHQPGDVVQAPQRAKHIVRGGINQGRFGLITTLCGQAFRFCEICGGDNLKLWRTNPYLKRAEATCRTCLRIEKQRGGEQR